MPERNQPPNPEVTAALRAYEDEMRDGTERGQRRAYEQLRIAQQRAVGEAAIRASSAQPTAQRAPEQQEPNLASA